MSSNRCARISLHHVIFITRAGRESPISGYRFDPITNHRLNMESDLHSLFGLHVTWCAQLFTADTPHPPPPRPPPAYGLIYEARYWAGSQDRRHLLAPPWIQFISFPDGAMRAGVRPEEEYVEADSWPVGQAVEVRAGDAGRLSLRCRRHGQPQGRLLGRSPQHRSAIILYVYM